MSEWSSSDGEEIKAQGYTGSERMLYRFLGPLRRNECIIQKADVPHAPLQDFSAHDAVWLFALDAADLDEQEQATLTTICQESEVARTTCQLLQECAADATYAIRKEAG